CLATQGVADCDVPYQPAIVCIDRDHMSVPGSAEQPAIVKRHTPVHVQWSRGGGTIVYPLHLARRSVNGVGPGVSGEIQRSVYRNRAGLKARRLTGVVGTESLKLVYVRRRNLLKRGEPIAGVVSVVSHPVGGGCIG